MLRSAGGPREPACRARVGGETHLLGDVPLEPLGGGEQGVGLPQAVPPLGVAQLEFVCRQHELGGEVPLNVGHQPPSVTPSTPSPAPGCPT